MNKELVIIDDSGKGILGRYIESLKDTQIRYIQLQPEKKTLGELRNIGIEQAAGEYVAQWDDDDLSDPLRLEIQMSAIRVLKADACCLLRELLWWPFASRLVLSRPRVWEGALLVKKDALCKYPTLRKGEDTPVVAYLMEHYRIALLDKPSLFLYVRHRNNTFSEEHFTSHLLSTQNVLTDEKYAEILTNLARRLPIKKYLQACQLADISLAQKKVSKKPKSVVEEKNIVTKKLDKQNLPNILILTPVKDASDYLEKYFVNLNTLTYPKEKISLGFIESDSSDGTFQLIKKKIPELEKKFRKVILLKHDFGFTPEQEKYDRNIQFERRAIMAKSRNMLLQRSLQDEEWVLWIDVDVMSFPENIIEIFLETGKEIIVPHCVTEPGGSTFDLNTFMLKEEGEKIYDEHDVYDGILQPPRGKGRHYLEDLREHTIVQVDSVGGTMLMIKAKLHREGLVFPAFSYKRYIETEGLAMMAKDMGYSCGALPNVEIIHHH